MSQANDIQLYTGAQREMTGVSLSETQGLFAPFETDVFGIRRRPLTQPGLKLSLELSRMAYSQDIEPWMRAGWTDFSLQVDNQLTTGLKARDDENFSDRVAALYGGMRLGHARRAVKEQHNPLAQVTGALRQREESDTLKAVVMLRPEAEGRYLLAIGFMGTGTRFYDWFSNFRVGMENGFHKGFYQLTQTFIKNEAQIVFPDAAERLHLPKLTLTDILDEMRGENSRFSLWMAGHSQGAAVMQVYCDHLLREKRLLPERVTGCGFASPTVAADNAAENSAAYPLYHVLNADDLIPRMGSLKHFGLCLQFSPDGRFRDAAYDWNQSAAARKARRDAQRLTLHITDTLSFLTAFTALLQVVVEEKPDDEIFGDSGGIWALAPFEKVFTFAGRKAKETLLSMIVYMRKTYQKLRGRGMDEAAIDFLMDRCRPIVRSMPLKTLLTALYDQLYPPHSLCRGKTGNGAYKRIVSDQSHRLKPFIWQVGAAALPYRRYARGFFAFTAGHRPARRVRARRHLPRRRRAIQARSR